MRNPRTWVWIALGVQCVGLAWDFIWHGLVNPGFEAKTVEQMVRHLSTVHLPLYLGVAATFLACAWALVDWRRRGGRGVAVPVAFGGSLLQVIGETWHAYTHLQLSTHSGPMAFAVSFAGMVIVVLALALSRRGRARAARDAERRRAA